MGLTTKQLWVGAAVLALTAASGIATATASTAAGTVPLAGNWEGSGSHGLPLSFSLARRHGRLVATSIALGAPLGCPATERDAQVLPLSGVGYVGPGSAPNQTSGRAVLSGRVPSRTRLAHITGEFTTPSSGVFSIGTRNPVGCGWPFPTLSWRVHRVPRTRIADGTWTASLTAPDITTGSVKLMVSGHGRVVQSFRSSYSCQTATVTSGGDFIDSPAYEFIRPNGSFYSPLHGNPIHGHRTTWGGWLTRGGKLTGTLTIYDACTKQLMRARFHGGLTARAARA